MRVDRIGAVVVMAVALSACGGAPVSDNTAATTAAAAAAGGSECATVDACLLAADTKGQDPKVADAARTKACDLGSGPACTKVGALAHQQTPPDHVHALAFSEKACGLSDGDGCINLGFIHANGWGTPKDLAKAETALEKGCELGKASGCEEAGVILYQGQGGVPVSFDKAFVLFGKACDGKNAKGCFNHGVGYLNGQGTKQDVQAALAEFKKACDAGDEGGCKTGKLVADKVAAMGGGAAGGGDKPADGGGGKAQLTVGSISADGFTINDLACELGSVGLTATVEIAAGLGKKKKDLDACAPAGDTPRVSWTFDGKQLASPKVEKASSPKVAACVEKALSGIPTSMEGKCAATLVIGKAKAAPKK